MKVTVVRTSNVQWTLESAQMARRWRTLHNEALHNCYCVYVWNVSRRVWNGHRHVGNVHRLCGMCADVCGMCTGMCGMCAYVCGMCVDMCYKPHQHMRIYALL